MAVLGELLRMHIDYTAWASARLVGAASQLTFEELVRDFQTADKSVLGTLVHVFAADRIWLKRLQGEPQAPFVTDADRSLAVLENDWPPLLDRWKKFVAGVSDEKAQEVIRYSDLAGRQWSQPLWQPILHVVNHATHHRGQVSGFLRAMGRVPPPLDLAAYQRETGAAKQIEK